MKYWYILALVSLAFSCGSLQPATRPPSDDRYAEATQLDEVIGDNGRLDGTNSEIGRRDEPAAVTDIVGEEPFDSPTGPYLPPKIPPTQYEPYIRRSATPKPALPPARNRCSMAVEVRNYDGLDGCGILLETDKGVLLRVGIRPRGGSLEVGTRISIGFEYMDHYEATDCANEDAVIRITCMRLLRVSSGVPRPVVCEAYDAPAQWLVDAAETVFATYITRFPWKDGRFVYLLESSEGQYLYDCRGYLICRPRRNCLSFIDNFGDGQIIYEN